MQRLWISTTLFGLLAVILGVVVLVWPGPSIIVAAVLGRLLSTLGLDAAIYKQRNTIERTAGVSGQMRKTRRCVRSSENASLVLFRV